MAQRCVLTRPGWESGSRVVRAWHMQRACLGTGKTTVSHPSVHAHSCTSVHTEGIQAVLPALCTVQGEEVGTPLSWHRLSCSWPGLCRLGVADTISRPCPRHLHARLQTGLPWLASSSSSFDTSPWSQWALPAACVKATSSPCCPGRKGANAEPDPSKLWGSQYCPCILGGCYWDAYGPAARSCMASKLLPCVSESPYCEQGLLV